MSAWLCHTRCYSCGIKLSVVGRKAVWICLVVILFWHAKERQRERERDRIWNLCLCILVTWLRHVLFYCISIGLFGENPRSEVVWLFRFVNLMYLQVLTCNIKQSGWTSLLGFFWKAQWSISIFNVLVGRVEYSPPYVEWLSLIMDVSKT